MQETISSTAPHIEIGQPRLFTSGAVLIVSAYGALLMLPFLAALMAVSVVKLGVLTVLIPVAAVILVAFFLPFGLGNAYVSRLVQSLNPAAAREGEGFVVQLSVSPRVRSGFCALLEDADDIGYLTFNDSGLLFQGDSVKVSVPYDCIKEVRPHNTRMRGPFIYGRRIGLVVAGLPNVNSLEFAERSSWLLPTSRKITKQLHKHLSKQ